MASSTTKPVATISAINEMVLRLKPKTYMRAKVLIKEAGTATAGMRAARQSRKNSNTTNTTRITAINSVFCASSKEARILGVRSCATCNCTSAGIMASNCGMRSRMASTVSIMLALASRRTISNTPGLSLIKPTLLRSCTESSTVATSCSRTALPSFQRIIKGAICAAVFICLPEFNHHCSSAFSTYPLGRN